MYNKTWLAYILCSIIECCLSRAVFQGRRRYGRGLSGRRWGVRWIGAQVAKICWATLRCWWLRECCTGQLSSAQTLAVRPAWSSPATSKPFSSNSQRSLQSAILTGNCICLFCWIYRLTDGKTVFTYIRRGTYLYGVVVLCDIRLFLGWKIESLLCVMLYEYSNKLYRYGLHSISGMDPGATTHPSHITDHFGENNVYGFLIKFYVYIYI